MLKSLFILFVLRVENLLSRYEKHLDSSFKHYSLDEMIVGANGPLLHHAYETYEILDSAMSKYWRVVNRDGKGHFLHLTEDIRSYTGNCSKDVDSC